MNSLTFSDLKKVANQQCSRVAVAACFKVPNQPPQPADCVRQQPQSMAESIKSVLALVLIAAGITALIAWTDDRPSDTVWQLRIGAPIAALLSLFVLLKMHFRADHATDYLLPLTGTYFNCNGFCFAFVVTEEDGTAFLHAYFQSQRDQPSSAVIALRPARGFFMTRSKISVIAIPVECPAAAFGVAKVPLPIPENLQGQYQPFEVGASVSYPQGKGRRIRFNDGIFLRSNSKAGKYSGPALDFAGSVADSIAGSKPATANIELPVGVADELLEECTIQITIHWQLGDAELEQAA